MSRPEYDNIQGIFWMSPFCIGGLTGIFNMNRFSFIVFIVSVLGLLAAGMARGQEEAVSLLSNGDFEKITDGKPNGWPMPAGVTLEEEEGNHFLRITSQGPEKVTTVYRVIEIKPEHKAFSFSVRGRAIDLVAGKALWHDGRVILDFKNAEGKKVGSGGAPNFKGTTKGGWAEKTTQFLVPEGATQLEIMPAMFNTKSGTLDLDDLKLIAIDPQPVIEAKAAAAAKKAEDQARRAALVKPKAPIATPDQYPPMLKVQGRDLVTPDGKVVWLQGVSLTSMEWGAAGEHILESTVEALDNWNANCLRLPVREHFYGGTGPWQADGGAGYRQLIDDVVNLCAARGKYMVIDLHRFRAPEQKDADFWKLVAEKYKDHPAVLFELFNEPHDISWATWQKGGPVSDQKKVAAAKKAGEVFAENSEKLKAFDSIGMQGLIDAVRSTGAKNIVIVGGLDWAYDLGGIAEGYTLDDKGGNGIMLSTHVYPWKSDWAGKFLMLADKYPLFLGEVGADEKKMDFLPADRQEDPYTWVPDMLGLIQKHKLNWTGWSFHTGATPRLLVDWQYTPTPFWGEFAKKALAGEQFEMKKMR